ncbi:TPA: alpha/beta hydrolase [Candidatus Saccharibacteria bacterium]|nr:alpha/beta hydrolase [Candidatus Saccharibacteria bacterium]HIO87591.1 alpha/beta hydrolase [Candidatus Saccharibacteria bacterium]
MEDREVITEIIGDNNSNHAIFYIHGFGENRYDGGDLLRDVAKSLPAFKNVLFDLNVEGAQGLTLNTLATQAERIQAVFEEHKTNKYSVIAHSMGCLLAAENQQLLQGAKKIIFLAPAAEDLHQTLQDAFKSRVPEFDVSSEMKIPRSNGTITTIPAEFWRELKNKTPKKTILGVSDSPQMHVIAAKNDEVLADNIFLSSETTNLQILDDNHNFSLKRDELCSAIQGIMSS